MTGLFNIYYIVQDTYMIDFSKITWIAKRKNSDSVSRIRTAATQEQRATTVQPAPVHKQKRKKKNNPRPKEQVSFPASHGSRVLEKRSLPFFLLLSVSRFSFFLFFSFHVTLLLFPFLLFSF